MESESILIKSESITIDYNQLQLITTEIQVEKTF